MQSKCKYEVHTYNYTPPPGTDIQANKAMWQILNKSGHTCSCICMSIIIIMYFIECISACTAVHVHLWSCSSKAAQSTSYIDMQRKLNRVYARPWLTANSVVFSCIGTLSPCIKPVQPIGTDRSVVFFLLGVNIWSAVCMWCTPSVRRVGIGAIGPTVVCLLFSFLIRCVARRVCLALCVRAFRYSFLDVCLALIKRKRSA